MPMTALVRNLATMTRVGVLAPGSAGTAKAVAGAATSTASRRWRSARGSGWTTPCGRSATCRSAAPTARCRCCTRSSREREIDTFVIYTDSETWAGDIHPAQALADYRRASGIDARLVVVGMVSNGFSIADPNDPGCSTSSASTRRRRS